MVSIKNEPSKIIKFITAKPSHREKTQNEKSRYAVG
jgi:hypothetical protein